MCAHTCFRTNTFGAHFWRQATTTTTPTNVTAPLLTCVSIIAQPNTLVVGIYGLAQSNRKTSSSLLAVVYAADAVCECVCVDISYAVEIKTNRFTCSNRVNSIRGSIVDVTHVPTIWAGADDRQTHVFYFYVVLLAIH